MKLSLLLVLLPLAIYADEAFVCEYDRKNVPTGWIKTDDVCICSVRVLIDKEMAAATQFLAISAFFMRVEVSRQGYAEFFLDSANHHRHNAKRLMSYLTMRGVNVKELNSLFNICYKPPKTEFANALEAVNYALQLWSTTTDDFRHVIGVCEDQEFNDFNLCNYLTVDFLYSQYHNMEKFARGSSSLAKVFKSNGYYGEFLLDVGYYNGFGK